LQVGNFIVLIWEKGSEKGTINDRSEIVRGFLWCYNANILTENTARNTTKKQQEA